MYYVIEVDQDYTQGGKWGPEEREVGRAGAKEKGHPNWVWKLDDGRKGLERNEETVLLRLVELCEQHNARQDPKGPRYWVVEDRNAGKLREKGAEGYPRLCIDKPHAGRGNVGRRLRIWWGGKGGGSSVVEGEPTLGKEVHGYIDMRWARAEGRGE